MNTFDCIASDSDGYLSSWLSLKKICGRFGEITGVKKMEGSLQTGLFLSELEVEISLYRIMASRPVNERRLFLGRGVGVAI